MNEEYTTGEAEAWRAARDAAAAECDALALVIERKGFNADAKPLRAAAERIRNMEPRP